MSLNLERALAELADSVAERPGALGTDELAGSTHRLVGRIRRRRAARGTGITLVAACAVGALAFGAAQLPGLLERPQVAVPGPTSDGQGATEEPAPTTDPGPGEVPAAEPWRELCGEPLGDPMSDPATPGYFEITAADQEGGDAASATARFHADAPGQTVVSNLQLSLVRDGVVLASGEASSTVDTVENGPGVIELAAASAPLVNCGTGNPLPSGGYDAYVLGTVQHHTEADGWTTSLAASDPWTELIVVPDAVLDIFPQCGTAAPESIHVLPDQGNLALGPDLPEGPWSVADLPALTGQLGATGGYSVIANAPPGYSLAIVDSTGTVIGNIGQVEPPVDLIEVGPVDTVALSAEVELTGCDADGLDAYLGEPLIVWPYIVVQPREYTDSDGNATVPGPDPVVVIANPQEITLIP